MTCKHRYIRNQSKRILAIHLEIIIIENVILPKAFVLVFLTVLFSKVLVYGSSPSRDNRADWVAHSLLMKQSTAEVDEISILYI